MKEKEKLPTYGVGPIYVIGIFLITVISIYLTISKKINTIHIKELSILFIIIGVLLILFGISLWIRAVIIDKVDDSIEKNMLCTKGVYSIVRNPIYSAFLFICTGALFIVNNLILLVLPIVYWLFLTILMINTEEKWLYNMFGDEYKVYCKKVNRCIPLKRAVSFNEKKDI